MLTSLYNTSQQWDAPNAWPPLQYFVIEGLNNYGGGPHPCVTLLWHVLALLAVGSFHQLLLVA